MFVQLGAMIIVILVCFCSFSFNVN